MTFHQDKGKIFLPNRKKLGCQALLLGKGRNVWGVGEGDATPLQCCNIAVLSGNFSTINNDTLVGQNICNSAKNVT
jgi:hypothetical protein